MKILLVADSVTPTDGPGRFTCGLASELARRVDRLEIALPRHHPPTPGVSTDIPPDVARLRVLPSRHFFYLRGPLYFPVVLWSALRLVPAARRCDLVHAVKDYPFSWVAALAAWIAGRPLVLTVFGTFALMPLDRPRDRWAALWTYARARKVFCLGHFTANRLKRSLADTSASKVLVEPPGIEPRFFRAEPVDQLNPASKPFVLGVGLVRPRKGFEFTLRAFLDVAAEYPKLELRIAGAMPDSSHADHLRALARHHEAGDRVRFLGEVSEKELLTLYRDCELFCLTPVRDDLGRFEGFGLVYCEAAAAGKATIGSLESGAEDAVVDGQTGILVPPRDVGAIATALRRLLSSPAERSRMGEAGRRRAARMTWPRLAERTLKDYDQILASRGSGS